jgi:lysozyme
MAGFFNGEEDVTDIAKIAQPGLDLIKSFEGWRATSYLCPAGVWTIGWGSTGPHVKPGMTITQERGEALLRADLGRFEAAVTRLVTVNVSQAQYDAMVSLAFNIGIAAFGRSSVLRHVNARSFDAAAKAFALWNKGGGRVLSGLVRRRAAESALFAS